MEMRQSTERAPHTGEAGGPWKVGEAGNRMCLPPLEHPDECSPSDTLILDSRAQSMSLSTEQTQASLISSKGTPYRKAGRDAGAGGGGGPPPHL